MTGRAAERITREIGFGIVGAGMIAEFHARAIAQVSGARLAGVATRDRMRGAAFAAEHGAPLATTRIEELLERPELDVLCVTTPSGAHREPALAAIGAGKHVVIEKPIEITVERVDEILQAAVAAGVLVVPIFQARFGDGARAVRAALDAGRFGRLVLASAAVKWHRRPEYYTGWKGTLGLDGGGAVMNQAIHAIDQLLWYAGTVVEVYAHAPRRVHPTIEAEDTAVATLRFFSGALGTIEASTAVWPGWARRIELMGESGSVALEDDRIARWEFRDAAPMEPTEPGAPANPLGSGASSPAAISHEGHRRQLQDLVEALQAGRRPQLVDADGRNAVLVARAIYASAASGAPVRLEEAG